MTVYNDDILNEWAERKKAQFIKKHSIPRKINQKSNPVDLLSSEPVVKLTGDEFLPVDGKTFVEQINEYFMSIGNTANSPFGEVRIDLKGIKNDIHHGSGRNKTCSFAAIKPVLENGTIIKPIGYYGTHQKKQASGMIAAPILIGDERYICVVLVVANLQFMRLYVHEVTLTKNLQEVVAQSNPVHSGEESTSRQPQGDISKALIDYINKNRAINTEQPITENKQDKSKKDMKENKQTIKLNESQLRKIIKESLKKILNEEYGDYNYGVTLYEINKYGGAYGFDEEHFVNQNEAIEFARKTISETDIPMVAECFTIYDSDDVDTQIIRGKEVNFYPSFDDEWKYTISNTKQKTCFGKIDEII